MKTYKVKCSHLFLGYCHQTSEQTFEGTMDELNSCFSYTLLLGNQEDRRIPLRPKTIKTLIRALNASAQATGRYHDHYQNV